MKYMGSKSRIAKHIVPIMQELLDGYGYDAYIEPFVGGANVIDKINHKKKIGMDKQKYLIEFLKHVRDINEYPKQITKAEYDSVRNFYNKGIGYYEDFYVGLVGFLASYNGRFFDGGYAKTTVTKTGKIRNYYKESVRNVQSQHKNLQDIEFITYDFFDLDVEDSFIYCDPPYRNRTHYGIDKKFDHDLFWEKARELSLKNTVVVSEEDAPKDFVVIWEQDVIRSINNNKKTKATEKLFIYKEMSYPERLPELLEQLV